MQFFPQRDGVGQIRWPGAHPRPARRHNRRGVHHRTANKMTAHPAGERRYSVIAPPSASLRIALAAAATLAAIALPLVAWPGAAGRPWYLPWAVAAAAVLAFAFLCLAHWRRSVALEAGTLVVRAGLNTRRVRASALELERARIIDLQQFPELQPRRRTLGASVPGFQSGWFRTRAWGKGFYLLTERRRVLWLPEHNGPHLLLSLQQPQALLAALNALAPRHDRG